MKTVWLIFKKDTRRFWPLMLMWFCLLTLVATITAAGFPNLVIGGGLLVGAYWIVFVLLAISLVQADRLVGDRELWMTRPVAPIALAGAKVLGLVVWLIFPAAMARVLAVLWLGATPHLWLVAGLEAALWTTALAFVVAALAAITATIAQWAIAAVSLLVLIDTVYWFTLNRIGRMIHQPHYAYNIQHGSTNWTAISIVACLFALAILVFQAVARRRARTVALALISFAVVWQFGAIWPLQHPPATPVVDFAPVSAPNLKIKPTAPPKRVFPFFDIAPGPIRDALATGVQPSLLVIPLRMSGTGDLLFSGLEHVESRLTTNSGTEEWDSRMEPYFEISTPKYFQPAISQPAISISSLSLPDVYRGLGWSDQEEAFPISTAVWGNKRTLLAPGESGKLETKLFLREYSVNVDAELPLREGAAVRIPGSYLQILKIEHAPSFSEGLIVTVEFHSLQEGISHPVFLLNRLRHELMAETGNTNYRTAGPMASTIHVFVERIRFGSWDPIRPGSANLPLLSIGWKESRFLEEPRNAKPSADWLSGASLAIVSLGPIGYVEKTIAIDPFTMPPEKTK